MCACDVEFEFAHFNDFADAAFARTHSSNQFVVVSQPIDAYECGNWWFQKSMGSELIDFVNW